MIQTNNKSRSFILEKIDNSNKIKHGQLSDVVADLKPVKDLIEKQPDDLLKLFQKNFEQLLGKFIAVDHRSLLPATLKQLITEQGWNKIYCKEPALQQVFNDLSFTNNLQDCDVSFTTCHALIARTGSMLITSNTESGRTASVYAPIHVCIATTNQLVYDLSDVYSHFQPSLFPNSFPSLISLATGPSRSADIEKTLTVGVHGPKEVYCVIY
ncbi:MAG: LUD domain-containing protein [Phycisphaerales bacterium]|nr:LUD domain-containing protein [Phycisphaerales bacterium]